MRNKYLVSFIHRSQRVILKPTAPLLILFLTIYIFSSGGHFYVLDQIFEYVTAQAIATNGNLNIAFALPLLHSLGFPTSGTFGGIDVPGNVSTYYSYFGVLQPILSVPFYILGTLLHTQEWRVIALTYTPLISAISVCLVFSIARRLGGSTRNSLVLSLMYGLGSIVWPYSKFYFDVSTAMVTLLAAAYFLFDQNSDLKSDLACGLFATLSVFARTSQVIMLPGFVVYLLYRRPHTRDRLRSLAVFLTPVVLGAVLFGYMNWVMVGSPCASGYGVLANPFSSTSYQNSWLLMGVFGLLFSANGLFTWYPLCAIGFFVLLLFARDRGQRFVLAWLFLAPLFFYARFVGFTSGPGARYLVMSTPFLILALEPFVRTAKTSLVRVLMLLVASAWGFVINLLGVLVNFDYVGAYLYEVFSYTTETYPGYWDPMYSPLRGAWDLLWSPVYPAIWYSNAPLTCPYPCMFFLKNRFDLYFYSLFGSPALAIFVCLAFAELFWLVKATSRETEHEVQNLRALDDSL